MNRTGLQFDKKLHKGANDVHLKKYKIGTAKFSVPAVTRGMNAAQTTHNSSFLKTFVKDARKSTQTQSAIDSRGFDIDKNQKTSAQDTKITDNSAESRLNNHIMDLKAAQNVKKHKVKIPSLSLHDRLKLLDNVNVALQSKEGQATDNFVAQSSDRQSSRNIGQTSQGHSHIFSLNDKLSPRFT